MLYIFRKEMKKWRYILLVPAVALVAGAFFGVIFRRPSPSEIRIASVDGYGIYLHEYQYALAQVQMKIEMLKYYAQAQGISADIFLTLQGLNNPPELAMKELINERLLDPICSDLQLHIDHEYMTQQLGASVPRQLLDAGGRIDEKNYREYLRRLSLSIHEYEDFKEEELKRNLVMRFADNALHVPYYNVRELFLKDALKKSFFILKIPFDKFLADTKKKPPSDDQLKTYFESHTEHYRIPEKRVAEFWTITKDEYLERIKVDDQAVELFYEKNKNTLYRIPPEVKVRKIVIAQEEKEPKEVLLSRARAEKLLKEVKANPDTFAAVAKQHSEDKETAKKGGLVDFFKRGTHDSTFETAAFRLKNPGDISDLVTTKDGFEIIKLVERKSAKSKPLSAVRDDIVKTIKSRRVTHKIKGDLEKMLYRSRTNLQAIDKFVKKRACKREQSKPLTKDDSKGYIKTSFLAKKIFAKKKLKANYGYFIYQDTYVVYREIERKKSTIPPFEQVKDQALKDYYALQARRELKKFVKKSKKELLNRTIILEALGQGVGQEVQALGMLKRESMTYKEVPGLLDRAFDLTDIHQVLLFKARPDYYLVQLEKTGEFDADEFEKQKQELGDKAEQEKKMIYTGAFIASLERNATIEQDEKILKLYGGR